MTENEFMRNSHLEGNTFVLEGNETGILLLHGFTATTAEVRLLGECLHQKGFTISAPLLPGHGTHPTDLNSVKWMDWFEAAEKAFLELRSKCKHVFIGGESMGSLPVLLLASRYTGIDGVMLFAPAIKLPGAWRAYLLKPFIPWIKKGPSKEELAWKGYNVYPVKGMIELLKLQMVAKRELKQILQPTITFTGARDMTISPDSGEFILDRIASKQKKLYKMPNSPHCIILGQERDEVCKICQNFILSTVEEKQQ